MSPATRISTLGSVVAALMLVALTAGTASAATRPITFNLAIGQTCVSGRASDSASLVLVWRSASGNLKAKATVPTSGDGYWNWCPPPGSGSTKVLRVGDRIKATVGSTVRQLTIPTLTLNVDRAQDLFRGKAPAGTTLRLFYLNGIFSDYYSEKGLTANANGRWSFDPGWNIMGGITADVRWNGPNGDKIWVSGHAPLLRVTIGRVGFTGETKSYQDVKVILETAAAVRRGTGNAVGDDYGTFAGQFRNAGGDLVAPAVGDRIRAPSLAPDANWIVPNIEGTANASTNVVDGRCFDAGTSGEFVDVRVIRTGTMRGRALGSTDQDGFFVFDFDDPESPFLDGANVKSGDRIDVYCLQDTGDWVGMRFTAP